MPTCRLSSALRRLCAAATAAAACAALAAPAPADAAFGFVGKWGSSGTADGQFQAPFGLDTDAAGNVYVADCQLNRVQKFDANGTFLARWGSSGTGNGQFDCARDVAVDSTGVYVVDFGNNRVQKFTTGGAYVSEFGGFVEPNSVATNGANVYVADTGPTSSPNPRVQRFSTSGALLGMVGSAGSGAGQYDKPLGVAVDGTGAVYVSDQGNVRVVKFNPAATWGTLGSGDGQFGGLQQGLDTDAGNNVWVADWGNNRIQEFSSSGTFLGKWGSTGSGDTQFKGPMDVAAGPGSTLYIADADNDRIVKYGEGGADPGGSAGCARVGHVVGVVNVCADAITSTGTGLWHAAGDVRLQGGVAVGGPVDMVDGTKTITSTGSVSLSVLRAGGAVTIGSGRFQIDGTGVTDPVSARSGLAKLQVFDFSQVLQATLGGLTSNLLGDQYVHYLDAADGGGVILSVKPSLDLIGAFANKAPIGSIALGIHVSAAKQLRVLGGSIGWNGLELGGGWKLGTLKLEYAEGNDAWAMTGGAEFPFISNVGGLEISGGLRGSRLDAIAVTLKTKGVPLGQTGIVLDTFGGSLKGLAGGTGNPLIVQALTGGGWTPTGAPEPFNWILHIKNVTLTINTSGSGSLAGGVAFLDKEGRIANAQITFTMQLYPSFAASGVLTAQLNFVLASASLDAYAAMNRSHITAAGTASGKLFGMTVGSGNGVVSDIGAGVTGTVCSPVPLPFIDDCYTAGVGGLWSEVTSFPPTFHAIGSNTSQFETVARPARVRAAAPRDFFFTVERRRPLLVVTGRGDAKEADFVLISPTGAFYRPGVTRADAYSRIYENGSVEALVVYGPRAGRWRLSPSSPGSGTSFDVQSVRALGRVRARTLKPRGTAKKPLTKKVKSVRASWRGTGLPATTRVDLYLGTRKGQPGRIVKRGLRRTGSYRIRYSKLAAGANWVVLVVRSGRIPFATVAFPRPVFRRAAR